MVPGDTTAWPARTLTIEGICSPKTERRPSHEVASAGRRLTLIGDTLAVCRPKTQHAAPRAGSQDACGHRTHGIGRDTTVITMQTRSVLYIVACGGRPAGDLPEFVRYAQDHGWNVCVIATPSGMKFLEPGPLADLTGHPVRCNYKRPDEPDVLAPRMRSW
jgi:hypothetical protein